MKYLTVSLWAEAQRPFEHPDNHVKWDQAFKDYRRQLVGLRDRLDEQAYAFFDSADVHDGELLEWKIIDGSRLANSWQAQSNNPVEVKLSVWDAYDKFVWHLTYSGVRKATTDFPGEELMIVHPGEGFGDWGYHELTDAGSGFLRHEILFRGGSVLAVEFRKVLVVKEVARAGSLTNGGG